MSGDMVIQNLHKDGEVVGLKLIRADDVILVSTELLETLDSPFADFTEPYLTVLTVDGPIVYRVGERSAEWPYTSRVAELAFA